MSITVWISASFRQGGDGKQEVEVAASDIAGCIDQLEIEFPGLKQRLLDESDELRPFAGIFVNGNSVSALQGLATRLKDGDKVGILPAFAGG